MNAVAREWLMLWTLQGRPVRLGWEMFRTAPEEVFEYLPEETAETLHAPNARSQRHIWTGSLPTLTITREVYLKHRRFRVDMHPHFPTPPNADRTYFDTFKEARAHAAHLVQRMETEHWHWRH